MQFLRESGPQSAVSETEARRSKNLETRKDVLVGINKYPNLKELWFKAPLADYEALAKNRAACVQAHRRASDPLNAARSAV